MVSDIHNVPYTGVVTVARVVSDIAGIELTRIVSIARTLPNCGGIEIAGGLTGVARPSKNMTRIQVAAIKAIASKLRNVPFITFAVRESIAGLFSSMSFSCDTGAAPVTGATTDKAGTPLAGT